MKPHYLLFLLLATVSSAIAQPKPATQNVFVITLDGMRWQEIFKGADAALIRNHSYVKDTSLMMQQYWHEDLGERRRRLFPFFWSVIASQGQLLGNRELDNKVNVANAFKISYPGYNEIFTGYADPRFIPNLSVNNSNTNILQFLNAQDPYKGKVAAFCSWRVLPFILGEKGSDLPVNAGYEMLPETDSMNALVNDVQHTVTDPEHTRHDLLTYECAMNYIHQHHPRVMYLGLGETDEFAHGGAYDVYLQKAHQADAMIADLWYYVQTDAFYKNNTTFIITTDHGRGRKTSNWKTHGFWVGGSGETWLAMLGNGIAATGEGNQKQQVYQKQLAATIAVLLGERFTPKHPVGKPIALEPLVNVSSQHEVR